MVKPARMKMPQTGALVMVDVLVLARMVVGVMVLARNGTVGKYQSCCNAFYNCICSFGWCNCFIFILRIRVWYKAGQLINASFKPHFLDKKFYIPRNDLRRNGVVLERARLCSMLCVTKNHVVLIRVWYIARQLINASFKS